MPPKTLTRFRDVFVASEIMPPTTNRAEPRWTLNNLAGRFVELSGSAPTAALTIAARLILQAQRKGELAGWVTDQKSTFYPPDFAAWNIDLRALPVVRAQGIDKASRAVDLLLRSGGFALVVFDCTSEAALSLAFQTRLAGLAKRHHTALVCITRKKSRSPSLGSLISVRGECGKKRVDFDRFQYGLRVTKDKLRGPGEGYVEVCHGPDGLC